MSSYSLANVSGEHYGTQRPVYILLSENTFSGAEAFSYTMQSLNRATLIGERTRGGAHLFEDVRLHEHFMMALPIARSLNPITQSSRQYVGVRPDYEVTAVSALDYSQRIMLEELIENSADDMAKVAKEFAFGLLAD